MKESVQFSTVQSDPDLIRLHPLLDGSVQSWTGSFKFWAVPSDSARVCPIKFVPSVQFQMVHLIRRVLRTLFQI